MTTRHKQHKKKPLDWSEMALIGILAVSVLMVGISLLIRAGFNPRGDAEAEMGRVADDYYRAYLYPRLLNFDFEHAEKLKSYATTGVPTVYLRQLLSYDDDKQAKSAHYFDNQYYKCNSNSTGVRYYPYEPYGPTDYTVEYIWNCKDYTEKTSTMPTDWVEVIEDDK